MKLFLSFLEIQRQISNETMTLLMFEIKIMNYMIKIHRMLYFAEVFLNGPQQIVKCWKAIMDFGERD